MPKRVIQRLAEFTEAHPVVFAVTFLVCWSACFWTIGTLAIWWRRHIP